MSIDVRPSAGGSQTIVNVMFPTGGWELRADSSTLRDGVAVARLTFVGPAADEMVTQALMQKPWTWPHKEPYKWIEVWVNVVRRGAQPRAPEYRLAARYPVAAMPAGAGGPARGAIPAQTSYRCGEEVFSITFAEGRASVTLGDKSVVTLERLKSDGASYEMRTFTNGRLTFVQELEHGKTARVRFARGRMVPTPCVRVE